MEKDFIIKKQIGNIKFMFDAKNMLLFDITNGFNEEEYKKLLIHHKNI